MRHSSFSLLERAYEKADKQKLVCDGCEFGKHTRSSYVRSGSKSSHAFVLVHSDIWGPCSTTKIDGHIIVCDFHRLLYLYHMVVLDEEQERCTYLLQAFS
jgi:hypothetical protein